MLDIDGSLKICDLKWSSLFFRSHISNLSDAPNLRIPELTSTAFMSLTDITSASSFRWKSSLLALNSGESTNEMRTSDTNT